MQFYIPHMQNLALMSNKEPLILYACKLEQRELLHPRSIHRHEDIVEIVYILAGQGVYEIAGRPYPVSAGDLVIYNSNVMHYEFNNDPQLPILCCAATGIQIPGMKPNCIVPEHISPVFPLENRAHIFRGIMQTLFEVASLNEPNTSKVCQSLFSALFDLTLSVIDARASMTALEKNKPGWKSSRLGQDFRAYVDAHLDGNLTAKQVSQAFDVSESYFARIFKQSTGCSLTTYIRRWRIGRAQNLLLMTDMTVAEIAYAVGYENQSYFTKLFSDSIGISPTRYRKLYCGIGSANKNDIGQHRTIQQG